VFVIETGKFFGFLLTERDIEVNPDKCTIVIRMRSSTNVKEVQQLIGRMVALSFLVCQWRQGVPLLPIS